MKKVYLNQERTDEMSYTYGDAADELGISKENLIEMLKKDGYLDDNDQPTQKAIDEGVLNPTKTGRFGEMTIEEIEQWEKVAEGIILFDGETGVSFQKSHEVNKVCTVQSDGADIHFKNPCGCNPCLVMIIDGIERNFVFVDAQIEYLKKFINEKF